MEDNGRKLDQDPVNAPPDRGRYPDRRKLTIMLLGSVGKIRSFKISRKLMLYTSIFFVFYVAASLIVFYLYMDLYTSHKTQYENIKKLKAELSENKKTLDQNKLYIKVLEDSRKGIAQNTDTGIEQKPEAGDLAKKKSQKPAGKPEQKVQEEKQAIADTGMKKTPEPEISKVNVPEEEKPPTPVSEETPKESMEVKDISFRKTDSELTLNFVLANKLANQKTAEGYIHIIVMDKDKGYPSDWNNSYNKLSNGFPVDFNHGQEFLIQRFRPYQRKYLTNPDSELPSFIRILVYDRSGQKILEKEFPVTDESANAQN